MSPAAAFLAGLGIGWATSLVAAGWFALRSVQEADDLFESRDEWGW